jgi:hypothetical protein
MRIGVANRTSKSEVGARCAFTSKPSAGGWLFSTMNLTLYFTVPLASTLKHRQSGATLGLEWSLS